MNFKCYFLQDLISVFEAHFQEPLGKENQNLQWTPLHKILNTKIINIHFQIKLSMPSLDFEKHFFEGQNSKNSNILKILLNFKVFLTPKYGALGI